MAVLRYPYNAITETTDYLQVDISTYEPIGSSFVRGRSGTSYRTLGAAPINGSTVTSNSLAKISVKENGTILLPMPSNIQDGNSVRYADDSLNGIVAGAVEKVGNLIDTDLFGPNAGNKLLGGMAGLGKILEDNNLKEIFKKSLAAQAVSVFGGNVTIDQLLARESGDIFNPNMELLFNGVTLRSFKFSFKMTPRSKEEAEQIKLIIRSLKKNMAPKVSDRGKDFLKTPNIFNIEYKKGSIPHPYLHKFKQCALTDINVNYTGENIYATYNDGSPISYIMDLTFRELEPIYDWDYDNGIGTDSVGY